MRNVLFGLTIVLAPSIEALGVTSDSSIRANKKAYAAVEVIGLTMMPVQALRAGYLFNKDLAAEVALGSGNAEIGDFKASKTILEAKAKYFFGNTFYVDGGLAIESWDLNYSVFKANSESFETVPMNGSVTTAGAEFHIGNQWQWNEFTLGCDWIGYFTGLSTKSSFRSNGDADEADVKNTSKDAEETFGGSSIHLTRLYVGYTF